MSGAKVRNALIVCLQMILSGGVGNAHSALWEIKLSQKEDCLIIMRRY